MYKTLPAPFQTLLNFIRHYRTHFLVWAIYMTYETVLVWLLFNISAHPIVYAAHYIVIILFFYLHANLLLPQILNKRSKLWFIYLVVAVCIELAAYILSHYAVGQLLLSFKMVDPGESKEIVLPYVLRNLYRGLNFFGFSTGYYFIKNYILEKERTAVLEKESLKEKIRLQQIEKELISAQNAFLQTQINPHFLFNTLDFVYHEVKTQSSKAGATIVSLANMMRYALDAGQTGHEVSLQDEIAQVQELIYINQVRKQNELNLTLKVEPEVQGLRIIPLVLLTLVENMFKHGDLKNKLHPASIHLFVKNEVFYIQTTNRSNVASTLMSTQHGLKNIQQRLDTSYSNQAEFTYEISTDRVFQTTLSIPIGLMR